MLSIKDLQPESPRVIRSSMLLKQGGVLPLPAADGWMRECGPAPAAGGGIPIGPTPPLAGTESMIGEIVRRQKTRKLKRSKPKIENA